MLPNFLAEVKPQAKAKRITRKLLLDYLNYLQKRVRTGCAKNNVLNLRNFVEMSHREAWLPLGPERLINDEKVPQPPKPQPRYLPSGFWINSVVILTISGLRGGE